MAVTDFPARATVWYVPPEPSRSPTQYRPQSAWWQNQPGLIVPEPPFGGRRNFDWPVPKGPLNRASWINLHFRTQSATILYLHGVLLAEVAAATAQVHRAELHPRAYGDINLAADAHTIVVTASDATTWTYTTLGPVNLVTSNIAPGGDEEASWEVEDIDPVGTLPPPGAAVVISDTYGPYWVGRVEDPGADFRPGGASVRVLARGYGSTAADQKYRTTRVFTAGTLLTDVFKTARDSAPDIGTSNEFIGALGRKLVIDTDDFVGQTPQDVWNNVAGLGSALDQPVVWVVRCADTSTPVLEVYERPTTAAYTIAMSACEQTPFRWPLQVVFNRVTVVWADGQVTVEDTTSQSGFPDGIDAIRDHYVPAQSQIGSEGQARFVADTLLNALKTVRPVSDRLTIRYPNVVYDARAATTVEVPLNRLRAGNVITVTGITTGNALLTVSPLFIKEVIWDEEARTVSLSVEEADTLPLIVGKVIRQSQNLFSSTNTLKQTERPDDKELPQDTEVPGAAESRLTYGDLPSGLDIVALPFVANSSPSVLTTGDKGFYSVPFDALVDELTLAIWRTAAGSQTVSARVWKSTYAAFLAKTILQTSSATGTALTTSAIARDAITPAKQILAGEIVGFEIVSVSGSEIVSWTLRAKRTAMVEPTSLDTTAPVISAVASTVTPKTATITWTTDEASDSWVEFGRSTTYGNVSSPTPDRTMVTAHSVTISGLKPSTLYYVKVASADVEGNLQTATLPSLTTEPA